MINLVRLVGEKYILEILQSISQKPRRFSDLKGVCSSDTTRTRKLNSIKDAGLIKAQIMKEKKRAFIYFILTEKGEDILKHIEKVQEADAI